MMLFVQFCSAVLEGLYDVFGDDYPTPDGTCVRDYIHVSDLAQAHLAALDHVAASDANLIVNCGYGHGYSVKEAIATVKKVTGVDFPVSMDKRRDGDAAKLISKASKIREVFGWTPRFDDLEVIVRTAYEWEKKL